MIPIEIQGANQFDNQTKANLHKHNGNTGLVVYSEPLHEWSPVFLPAFNPIYGAEMAQNFSFGGTPDGVHNGLDSVLWTATNESGNKFSFDSTDQAHSGVQSIKANKPAVNNTMQIDNGSNIDLSNYVALTMFIYVSNNWGTGDSVSIYGWDTGSGQTVGNEVFLEDFFNETDFGQWHKVVIPLDDMGLTSSAVDSFRIECVSTLGQSPTFYIDDFQIEETGNTSIFTLTTGNDTLMEVHQISFSIVAPLDIRLADATTINLSYDKFLNLNALDNGLLFQSIQNKQILFSGASKTIGDLIKGGATLKNVISDGTNTCITLESNFGSALLVDSRTNDSLNFILSDDLSGLISLSVLYKGRARRV